jgi:hypothetical protein
METRRLLQIVLVVIVLLVVGMGSFIVWSLTRKADKQIVREVIADSGPKVERVNPWSTKGAGAIELIKLQTVTINKEYTAEEQAKRKGQPPEQEVIKLGELLEREAFIRTRLKIKAPEKVGWAAQWWGETKFGPSFFLVTYSYKDENILVGPQWLVDIKTGKLVSKNVLARVAMDPIKNMEDAYHDKHEQVVSALANHRFESTLNLSGALLLYFEQREEGAEGDKILGWTIIHDRGALFKAYFQWVEAGAPTYAEFEFDYDKKALKAINLQAANVMRIGEDFVKTTRVSILPNSYDPEAKPDKRWGGEAAKQCQTDEAKDRCQAMSAVFEQREIVESLEWLLTVQSGKAEDFDSCKLARNCSWGAKEVNEGVYAVSYNYNLDGKRARQVTWEIGLKNSAITPKDRTSSASYLAVHPR